MSYIDDQVAKLEKRIQKIKANPDPTKPLSNLLLYEADLEQRKAQIAAQREGRPFALASNLLAIIARALGFEVIDPTRAADRITPEKVAYYVERSRCLGLPDCLCDRPSLYLPLLLEENGLPCPNIVLSVLGHCELHALGRNVTGHLLGIPVFHINIPFEDDYKPHLGYVARQVEELIAFAEEKVPGIKYDEDRLKGLVEAEYEWYALNRQICQLTKRVPCPAHPQEVFRAPSHTTAFPNPEKILQYMRSLRDDLSAKVERGYSPVKEEKLRLMWTTSGHYSSKIWGRLLERGVTVPYVHFGETARNYSVGYPGMGDTTEYGRKLSPIEEVARTLLGNAFGGTANRWIDQALTACRESKIDAIVNFETEGCISAVVFSQLLKDAAERELGIPSLSVAGRQQMHTKEDEEQLWEKVDVFITGCLRRKGF